MISSNQKTLLLKWGNPLCMFSFTFLLFYLYTKHFVYWDIFTARDIMRAQGWLEGRFHWPGPEMSGGTNLPGPFFYFLLFPPLMFGDNIYSQSLLWYVSWLALTYTVAFSFIEKITKHKESLLIFLVSLVVSIGSPMFRPLFFAWNPGFSILFHVLALMGLYHWRETNKDLYLYLVGLVIALGMQVHLLVAVHIITVLLFYFLEKKRKILPIVLFLFLACFPVLLYNILDFFHVFETSTSKYLKHLFHLKRNFFSEKWMRNIKRMFSLYYTIPLVFVFLSLAFYRKKQTNRWPVTKLTGDFFIMITVPCCVVFVIAYNTWYTCFIPVFLILFFSKWYDDLMPDNSNEKLNYLLVYGFVAAFPLLLFGNTISLLSVNTLLYVIEVHHIVLLSALLILLLVINLKWTYRYLIKISILLIFFLIIGQMKVIKELWPLKPSIPDSFSLAWPRHQYFYPLMKQIYLETNWLPKEAVKRIYAIGIHLMKSVCSLIIQWQGKL